MPRLKKPLRSDSPEGLGTRLKRSLLMDLLSDKYFMFPTLAAHSARDFSLLPPLHLYRRILRAHRHKLPPDVRLLGDGYVKSEFRLHRDITNPLHIIGFLTEWQKYAQQLEGNSWREGKLDTAKLDRMSGM